MGPRRCRRRNVEVGSGADVGSTVVWRDCRGSATIAHASDSRGRHYGWRGVTCKSLFLQQCLVINNLGVGIEENRRGTSSNHARCRVSFSTRVCCSTFHGCCRHLLLLGQRQSSSSSLDWRKVTPAVDGRPSLVLQPPPIHFIAPLRRRKSLRGLLLLLISYSRRSKRVTTEVRRSAIGVVGVSVKECAFVGRGGAEERRIAVVAVPAWRWGAVHNKPTHRDKVLPRHATLPLG